MDRQTDRLADRLKTHTRAHTHTHTHARSDRSRRQKDKYTQPDKSGRFFFCLGLKKKRKFNKFVKKSTVARSLYYKIFTTVAVIS